MVGGRLVVHCGWSWGVAAQEQRRRPEALFEFRTVFRSCLFSISLRHSCQTEVVLLKKAPPLAEQPLEHTYMSVGSTAQLHAGLERMCDNDECSFSIYDV